MTDVQILLGNIYDETSAPTQTAFTEWNETINYFQEHCNAEGTHLIIHYPRNVDIMLIKMKGESHFHLLLRFIGLLKSSLPWGWARWWRAHPGEPKTVTQTRTGAPQGQETAPPKQKKNYLSSLPNPSPTDACVATIRNDFLSSGHWQILVLSFKTLILDIAAQWGSSMSASSKNAE